MDGFLPLGLTDLTQGRPGPLRSCGHCCRERSTCLLKPDWTCPQVLQAEDSPLRDGETSTQSYG
jgi:hypothetical protein